MRLWQAKVGWSLAGLYLATAALLICSQGLFGESFVAVTLGLPWSALLVFVGAQKPGSLLLYAVVLFPLVLNASLLYLLGFGLERFFKHLQSR